MDTKIIAAVITASATLLGVMLTWILKNLSYSAIPKAKQRIVVGSWRGITHQISGPSNAPIDVDLVVELKTFWRRVYGNCRVQGGGDELNIKIHGGYKSLDHFVMEFTSNNMNKINFGFAILKLNSNGDLLIGKVVGYGNMSEKLVEGDIKLKKINT